MPPELINSTETRFHELESIIEKGKLTFVEVGKALAEIRDNEHWFREGYKSFAEYCERRWGWKKAYCSQIISATETVESLPEGKKFAMANERQARELAKVAPAKREQVLDAAISKAKAEDRPLKAADIAEAAEQDVDADEPAPRKLSPAAQSMAENFYAVQVEEAIEGIITECLADGSAVQWKSVQNVLMSFWSMRKTDK